MVSKRIGAAAAIFDDQGQILLVKHNYGPLNWELPGGGSEPGETIVETALRETLEETSLIVKPIRSTGVYFYDANDSIGFVFLCERNDNSLPIPQESEISECAYWPTDNLPHPISDFTLLRIHDAASGKMQLLPVNVPERKIFE
jgi:8-oxo-dGTP pyrophosphatase MutT (NUDIX family)